MELYALNTQGIADQDIDDVLRRLPQVNTKLGHVIRHTIRVIHSAPKLFEDWQLGDLVAYVGRSSPQNIKGRFYSHRNSRGDLYGVPIAFVPTKHIRIIEELAIRFVTGLKEHGCLCVSNLTTDARGKLPESRMSLLYLTFKWRTTDNPNRPTKTIVRNVVSELKEDFVMTQSLQSAFSVASRTSETVNLVWHPNHED